MASGVMRFTEEVLAGFREWGLAKGVRNMFGRVWFLTMVCLAALAIEAAGASALEIGEKGTDFTLAGTDGRVYSLATLKEAKVVTVVFTCNHCPVAQAYESRLIDIAKNYKDKGVAVVAISSNDPESVPQDSFENMLRQAKAKKYPHPYLFDPDQTVAKAYGATCTPHVFVLDKERNLAYKGAVDDNDNARGVKEHWLKDALDALLAGKAPERAATKERGCSIKWKRK